MSAPEPSAKPLPHNLDPEGEGERGVGEIALSKKEKLGSYRLQSFTELRAITSFLTCD